MGRGLYAYFIIGNVSYLRKLNLLVRDCNGPRVDMSVGSIDRDHKETVEKGMVCLAYIQWW